MTDYRIQLLRCIRSRGSRHCSAVRRSRRTVTPWLTCTSVSSVPLSIHRLLPPRTSARRSRPSDDPWFDDNCCNVKRRSRRLERRARQSMAARAARKSQLRAYRRLIGSEHETLWKTLVAHGAEVHAEAHVAVHRQAAWSSRRQGSDNVSDTTASTSSTATPSLASTDCVFSGFRRRGETLRFRCCVEPSRPLIPPWPDCCRTLCRRSTLAIKSNQIKFIFQ